MTPAPALTLVIALHAARLVPVHGWCAGARPFITTEACVRAQARRLLRRKR